VVLGVSAMDVPQRRFADVIDRVGQCDRRAGRQCYLLDEEARLVTPVDGDERTIGLSFVPRQPSIALALLQRGFLQRTQVPDFVSGVVCERWVLDISNDTSANASFVEAKIVGGCPSGDLWLSAIESDAPTELAGDAQPIPMDSVLGISQSGIADSKVLAPRLFMVIIDEYKFGVGGDCATLPPELRVDSDDVKCRPYVVDQCANREFAEESRPVEVQCTDYEGLSRAVVDELRRSQGTPKLEQVCAVQDTPTPELDDLNLWLVIALPVIAFVLCCGALIAVVLVRARKRVTETTVTVEQREVPDDPAAAEIADDARSVSDASVSDASVSDNHDALKVWAPPE